MIRLQYKQHATADILNLNCQPADFLFNSRQSLQIINKSYTSVQINGGRGAGELPGS